MHKSHGWDVQNNSEKKMPTHSKLPFLPDLWHPPPKKSYAAILFLLYRMALSPFVYSLLLCLPIYLCPPQIITCLWNCICSECYTFFFTKLILPISISTFLWWTTCNCHKCIPAFILIQNKNNIKHIFHGFNHFIIMKLRSVFSTLIMQDQTTFIDICYSFTLSLPFTFWIRYMKFFTFTEKSLWIISLEDTCEFC